MNSITFGDGLCLRYFLIGTLGKNLALSPRCTLATFVLMDLIGSSPKSDRYADWPHCSPSLTGYAAPFSSLYGAPIAFPLSPRSIPATNDRLEISILTAKRLVGHQQTGRSLTPLTDEWNALFRKENIHSVPSSVRLKTRET